MSELEELRKLIVPGKNRKEIAEAIEAYISKHYIKKEDVNTIIKASESVNAQYHGRDDCKSCGLAEALKLKLNLGDK